MKARKIRFYPQEFDRILRSSGVMGVVKSEAHRIKAKCGDGFGVREVESNWHKSGQSSRRACIVGPVKPEARKRQAEEKLLEKAIRGG